MTEIDKSLPERIAAAESVEDLKRLWVSRKADFRTGPDAKWLVALYKAKRRTLRTKEELLLELQAEEELLRIQAKEELFRILRAEEEAMTTTQREEGN